MQVVTHRVNGNSMIPNENLVFLGNPRGHQGAGVTWRGLLLAAVTQAVAFDEDTG